MTSGERIRVLIADDHPLFRDGVHGLLDSVPDVTVVGEAASGEDAVRLATSLRPDVVLMDIKMCGLNGIEATRAILGQAPDVAVLMLTMLEDDDSVFAAMRTGAHGYVLKGAGQAELLRAIRATANREAIFSPGIARRLIHFLGAPRPRDTAALFPDLTPREAEVLGLLAEGRSNTEIAETLSISLKTVRNHVSNVFGKLQVADRAQAVLRTREAGL